MKVILIGDGKLTYFLGKKFVEEKHQVTIINAHSAEAETFSHQIKATVIFGDGTHPTILEEAEASRADLVLALTPHDEDNLVACQIAQQYYGVSRTIALVNDPSHQQFFEQIGITIAFSATQILANLIEKRADFEDIANFLAVDGGQIGVTEIILDENSSAIGKALQNLALPAGALIGCIIREGRAFVPSGGSLLQVGDRLILISQPEHYEQFLEVLT
ncbi:MAG: TrkA family potassium uptake protein [Xenococcaceae cyanobacterium MO_188.B32]|nr:TrkA family potassium uptake protein [Xenococcaceae cyanobacterium MO_188.B32]